MELKPHNVFSIQLGGFYSSMHRTYNTSNDFSSVKSPAASNVKGFCSRLLVCHGKGNKQNAMADIVES